MRSRLGVGQMLADRLQAVGLPIRIVAIDGDEIAVHQEFHFVLGNLALVAIAQYATRTDIIIVVEQLCGVGVDDALGVNLVESIVGLVFQSHII